MKRHFLLLVAMVVFSTAFTTNVSGQTEKAVRANVKFDFQIGDRVYPSGEYRIESVGRQPDNTLRIISVSDMNKTQFILANHSNAGKTQVPKLVFKKYGENYFLTEIVLESGQWGYSLNPSRDRHSERNLASRLPSEHLQVVTLSKPSH